MTPRQLARVARVRDVQLLIARAAQADADAQAASETALSARVARLAADIAPVASTGAGFSLSAAAHYRDRLQQTAAAAQYRVDQAQLRAAAAAEASRGAERDLKAVEKLQVRSEATAMLAAIREMEAAPSSTRKRHDPC